MSHLVKVSAFVGGHARSHPRKHTGDAPPAVPSAGDRAMMPSGDQRRWSMLERHAHRADVQAMIRQEIRRGTIRVVPGPRGGIRIIPM